MVAFKRVRLCFPVVVIFSLALSIALILSAVLQRSAQMEWRKSALAQVDSISRIFTYWIDIEVGYINAITASYYTFPKVKSTQLADFMRYSRLFSQSQNLISIGTVDENYQGKLEVTYANKDTDWVFQGMVLENKMTALKTVDSLLLDTGHLILGPIVKSNESDAVVYVASLAPSEDAGGILLTYLPLSDMLKGLNQVYLPEGVALRVTSLTDIDRSDHIAVSNKAEGKPLLEYTQRIFHSNVDWVLEWQIYPNFEGGVNNSAAKVTLYLGILLALVLSLIVYVLRNQTDQIRNKVDRQTKELQLKNEHLVRTQQDLVQSEKMASLGSLVAGVAHELNTPLGISLTGISLVQEQINDLKSDFEQNKLTKSKLTDAMSGLDKSSQLVATSVSRSVELIGNFKMVAVDQTSDRRRKFSLAQSVHEIGATLNHKLSQQNVTLEMNLDDNIVLDSFPGSFIQIFSNLIINSLIHGFTDKSEGTITIEAEVIGQDVVITYKDNGKGIDEAHINKVFNPFYTTKLGQGGSGLGLNIVYNLVHKALGGKINLSSQLGEGVCFVISLPLIAPNLTAS